MCPGCFAQHQVSKELGEAEWLNCIDMIDRETKSFSRRKANLVGGEPTLIPFLPRLASHLKDLGFIVGLISNGARITAAWLDSIKGAIDLLGVSIDSLDPIVNRKLGRVDCGTPMDKYRYSQIVEAIHAAGMALKLNTVVSDYNAHENFNDFIAFARPKRWKIMQYLELTGMNDTVGGFSIDNVAFWAFVERHRFCAGIAVEESRSMIDSYIMIDPAGRPYGNSGSRIQYGSPILESGLVDQLASLGYRREATAARGGFYF